MTMSEEMPIKAKAICKEVTKIIGYDTDYMLLNNRWWGNVYFYTDNDEMFCTYVMGDEKVEEACVLISMVIKSPTCGPYTMTIEAIIESLTGRTIEINIQDKYGRVIMDGIPVYFEINSSEAPHVTAYRILDRWRIMNNNKQLGIKYLEETE